MAETAQTLLEAAQPWIENEEKAGRILAMGGDVDGVGGAAIVEYDSNDALHAKLMENPFSPFLQYCVKPLADWKLINEIAKQFFKKMAEA